MSRLGAALTTLALGIVVLADPQRWAERPILIVVMMFLTAAAWARRSSHIASLLPPVVIGLAGWVGHPAIMAIVTTFAIAGLAFGDPTSDRTVPSRGAVAMICVVVAGLVLSPLSLGPLAEGGDSDEVPDTAWQPNPEALAEYLAGPSGYLGPPQPAQGLATDLLAPADLRDFASGIDASGSPTAGAADGASALVWLLLGIAAVVVIAALWWRLRRAGFEAPPQQDAVRNQSLARLETIGRHIGRPRGLNEPPLAFARALDAMTGDRSFRLVGASLASALYAPGAETGAELSELLGELEERYV